jgi:hypothetical protein
MSLGLAARFSTLAEAEVACSAMKAAGLHAVVFDRGVCTNLWTEQIAFGGARVMTLTSQLGDAGELLDAIRRDAPGADDDALAAGLGSGIAITALALILGLGLIPYAGWCAVPLKYRVTFGRVLVVVALLACGVFVWALVVSSWGASADSG